MGKHKNNHGTKPVPTEKGINCQSEQMSSGMENMEPPASEMEIRLGRLENAHSNRGSDVYKFAFFFMGVVVTVLVYPRVSTTLELFSGESSTTLSQQQRKSMEAEQLYDADDFVDEKISESENTLRDKKLNKDTLLGDMRNRNETSKIIIDRRDTQIDKIDMLKQETDEETAAENDEKEFNLKERKVHQDSEEQTSKRRTEDLMIEEYDEVEYDVVNDVSNVEGDIHEIPIQINSEPQRVELFSANVDDLVEEMPVKFENNDKNSESVAKANPSQKSDKSAKKKSVHKETPDKSDDKNKDKKNIPPEIKNFKATYQKTLTPKKVFIDGRRIPPMELLPQKPNNSSVKVWLFEEFLSEEECDGLMRVHNKHVEEQSKDDPILCFDSVSTLRKHLKNVGKKVNVTPLDFTQGTTCVNASFSRQLKDWLHSNWSYSTAFYPGESRFASVFEQRVKQAMGLNPENGGKFQITSYPTGIGYKSHTDCTEDLEDKRDRMATILVYLDTVSEGGETEFTELGVWARPRKGRALLWNNMSPEGKCEPLSIHRANKVINGHKYILQRWYYYKSFYSLGKRPPEPPLPQRNPNQPRVSCDEYEHGSCRWYDEWNFEHLIEYERQKFTLV